jgi:hypothetical protein
MVVIGWGVAAPPVSISFQSLLDACEVKSYLPLVWSHRGSAPKEREREREHHKGLRG